MKFLFVSATYPQDINKFGCGIHKRMEMFIDALKGLGDIEMLFFVGPNIDTSHEAQQKSQKMLSDFFGTEIKLSFCSRDVPEHQSDWDIYGAPIFSFFKKMPYKTMSSKKQIGAVEQCLLNMPDVIFAHRLISMSPFLKFRRPLPPIFFDLDDIEHVAFFRNIAAPPYWRSKKIFYLHIPTLLSGERRAIKMAKRTFVCSKNDRQYLEKKLKLSGVIALHNAVKIPEPQSVIQKRTVLFLGTYNYGPNVIAAEFLIEKIWPKILKSFPDATLIIAGESPEKIKWFNTVVTGVEFAGYVNDLGGLYERSRVICTPILSGSGTRVKIIEAASYSKPIVSTRVGAEGLEFKDGQEIIIHDQPEDIASSCVKLLTDDNLCRNLGKAAREKTKKIYQRENVVKNIQKHIMVGLRDQPSLPQPGGV